MDSALRRHFLLYLDHDLVRAEGTPGLALPGPLLGGRWYEAFRAAWVRRRIA